MYFKEIKEQLTELKEYAVEYKRIKDALEAAFDNIDGDAFSVAEKQFEEVAEDYEYYSTRAENLLDSERDYINEQLEEGDINDDGHDKQENKLGALYCEWEDVKSDVGNIENNIRGYIQDVVFLQTMKDNIWVETAIYKGERKERVMNCTWNESHSPMTTTTSNTENKPMTTTTSNTENKPMTTTTSAPAPAKMLETLAQWGRLSRARKDVVPRVLDMARVTVARLNGAWKRRAESIKSDALHSCYTDADAADARRIAKLFYELVKEVLAAAKDAATVTENGTTPETETETTPETETETTPETETETTPETETETTPETETETTPETETETTPETETETTPETNAPAAYIVQTLDAAAPGAPFNILTTIDDSDKIPASSVLAYIANGGALVGALVPSEYRDAVHVCGYIIAARDLVKRSGVVFEFRTEQTKDDYLTVYGQNGNGVEFERIAGYLTTPPAASILPTTTQQTEKEVQTMKEESTPRPLSLVKTPPRVNIGAKLGAALDRRNKQHEKNAALIQSIKQGTNAETAPRLVKSAAPVKSSDAVKSVDAVPVPDSEKSRLYIWKDGKKAYATTPAAAPEYRLRTILKVAHAYFDRCTHEWIFTYQKEVIRELVSNGARLVESRENVPGFDPAKLDLHERVKWEFKQGRVAWIEGQRFNLTSEPRGYYSGAPLSKRNSELVGRIPTYFLTEKTAEKVAKETGLTITLKPGADIFAVRVPRFEKTDDDGNGIGTPVNYYWETAYKQEDFDGLPQKTLESPDVVDLERIRRAIGAAPNGNLLEAFRFAASKVASLANLTKERHALAVEIAACVALSSIGLVPRDFIKDIDQYAEQWRAALFATNGAKVALEKGQEAAIEILTNIGVKVPTTTAPAAKA